MPFKGSESGISNQPRLLPGPRSTQSERHRLKLPSGVRVQGLCHVLAALVLAGGTWNLAAQPVLPAPTNRTIAELTMLVVTNTASESGYVVQWITNTFYFTYTNRAALLADGWSFLATEADGTVRDTEITDTEDGAVVSYDQEAHPGVLRIPCDSGDLWIYANSTRNSLFRSLPASWRSMELAFAFAPAAIYQQMNLVLYQDDDNYLEVGLAYGIGGKAVAGTEEISAGANNWKAVSTTATNLCVRLDRDPATDRITSLYSLDGTNWVSLGQRGQTLMNARLGIWAGGSRGGFPSVDLRSVKIVTTNQVPFVQIYRLLKGPAGAVIDSDGVIQWSPGEEQGPGTNQLMTVVTDNGQPPLSATNSFEVVVNEVNQPPVLPGRSNVVLSGQQRLAVSNTATDPDWPANSLSYQLVSGPAGAVIDSEGVINWTPAVAQVPSTNVFTTVVSDWNPWAVNAQQLSATNSFTVVVNATGSQRTWYISQTAGGGLKSGTSWADAWTEFASVVWGGANGVNPGDTLMVGPGTYNEFVTLTASGTATAPITITGPATLGGMEVQASYLIISNLVLDANAFAGGAPVALMSVPAGSGHNVIGNCKVQLEQNDGLSGLEIEGNDNTVVGCRFDGCSDSTFVSLDGSSNLVTQCLLTNGLDADAFIVFGYHNTVSSNEVVHLTNPDWETKNHADFIQTFTYDITVSNIVVEANYVHDCDIQVGNLSIDSGDNHDWDIRNNVFVNVGNSIFVGVRNVRLYNNLFYRVSHAQSQVILFYTLPTGYDCRGGEVANNVFLECGTDPADPREGAIGSQGAALDCLRIERNYFGGSNYMAKAGAYLGAAPINGGDPGFINETKRDFHLRMDSRLVDSGMALAGFDVDKEGGLRPQGAGWDLGPYEYSAGVGETNPPPTVTAILQDMADSDPAIPGLQVLEGAAVHYSASASDPEGQALSWQWAYTVNSGVEVVYASGTGAVAGIAFVYGAGTAGQLYDWTLRVCNAQHCVRTGLEVQVVSGPRPAANLTFEAESGVITAPFVAVDGCIYQPVQTDTASGGRAVCSFVVTNAGAYVIQGRVQAPSLLERSILLNVDAEPDASMVWQVPAGPGFESQLVSWPGNGTCGNPQFAPKVFNLASGAHQVILRGLDANVKLDCLALIALPTVTTLFATQITDRSALLWGRVNCQGTPASAFFEYGLTASYDFSTPAPGVGSGSAVQDFSWRVFDLAPQTVYHFRIGARSAGGYAYGADQTFTTALTPTLLSPSFRAQQFSISLGTAAGRVYYLESKSSLGYATWTPVTNLLGDGLVHVLTDPAARGLQRFYRVRVE